jgi:hypothetical protein
MKNLILIPWAGLLAALVVAPSSLAQTDGTARLDTTILDYPGDSTAEHWTVAWVTTESGVFIKSLRKQGPSWTQTHWGSHCRTWNDARGGSASGSQALDGYSSATAYSYTSTNSPLIITWNCRNAAGALVPDGKYKFWVQYAEDAGQGPHTTNGMVWTKGPVAATNTYADVSGYFVNRKVTWAPIPAVAPTITSAAPPASGTVGVAYNHTCTATGTTPITFTTPDLPAGLTLSAAGVISGRPTMSGSFSGTITAANGTAPNATQAFSISVGVVPASITAIELQGTNLVFTGTGPANGLCTVQASSGASAASWTPIGTPAFDAGGNLRFTNAINPNLPQQYYRLQVP